MLNHCKFLSRQLLSVVEKVPHDQRRWERPCIVLVGQGVRFFVQLTAHPAEKRYTQGHVMCWVWTKSEMGWSLVMDLDAITEWSDIEWCMEHDDMSVSEGEIVDQVANLGRKSKKARLLLVLRPSTSCESVNQSLSCSGNMMAKNDSPSSLNRRVGTYN